MMASSTAGAVGFKLSKEYSIGKYLAAGGQGVVHVVDKNGRADGKWVAKVVPVPPTVAATTNKKRKKTPAEKNVITLNGECNLYANHLLHLCGDVLPELGRVDRINSFHGYTDPRGPGGFRYMIIERMQATLFDSIATIALMKDIAPIAHRLLEFVQKFHDANHLLNDVKADNIMLTNGTTKQSIAQRLRIVDLGLVDPYHSISGKRVPKTVDDMKGTPLYASVYVHDKNLPSRRDDVEGILYVIADLLIRVQANANGKYAASGGSLLPWADATSDDAIGKAKKELVPDAKSELYQLLPSAARRPMFSAFKAVRKYEFAEPVNFDSLREILRSLPIDQPAAGARKGKIAVQPRPSKRAAAASSSVSTTPSTHGRHTRAAAAAEKGTSLSRIRLHADSDDDDDSNNVSPSKRAKKMSAVEDMLMEDSFDTHGSFESPAASDVEMEDAMAAPSTGADVAGSKPSVTARIAGKGITFQLPLNVPVIVGSAPAPRHGELAWTIANKNVLPNHAKLEYLSYKRLTMIKVTNLGKGEARVDKHVIGPGKDLQSLGGQSIRIGDVMIEWSERAAVAASSQTKKNAPPPSKGASSKHDKPAAVATMGKENRVGMVLKVVRGPDIGRDDIVLTQDGVSQIWIGRNPTDKRGRTETLSDDSMEPNHAKLTLHVSKFKVVSVAVEAPYGNTKINGKLMTRKEQSVLTGDMITLGGTTLSVREV